MGYIKREYRGAYLGVRLWDGEASLVFGNERLWHHLCEPLVSMIKLISGSHVFKCDKINNDERMPVYELSFIYIVMVII